ncbi:MAG: methyl-accepting chemotaxis protein [Isosphaeraceae bacterium]|nr:methyl-accepting chemotaxis protein [Isosphaeraceae bacterium]
MKIVILIGGLTGFLGAILTLGIARAPATDWAWVLGPLLATPLGALATWLGLRIAEERLVDRLSACFAGGVDGEGPGVFPLERARRGGIDGLVLNLGQALYRLGRVNAELQEVERQARSALAAEGGAVDTNHNAAGRPWVSAVLDEVGMTAERVLHLADAVVDHNDQSIRLAFEQHEAVTPASALGELLAGETGRIAKEASALRDLGEQGRLTAVQGLGQVVQAIQGMARLRAFVESNGRKVRRHGDRSVEIGSIAELIVSISRRTDTLALNATIESVRAGVHGRGFAIVAEEIRKLAERTSDAVREIGALVEAIQAETHDSLRSLEEEQVEVGLEMERLAAVRAVLERMVETLTNSTRAAAGIAQAAGDQVESAQEMTFTVGRVAETTRSAHGRSVQVREQLKVLAQLSERLRRLGGLDASGPPRTAIPLGAGASSKAAYQDRRHYSAESSSC